jgi:hypothetical protein
LLRAVMHETAETSSEPCLHTAATNDSSRLPTWPRRIHIDLFHGPNLNPRREQMDLALLLGSVAVS